MKNKGEHAWRATFQSNTNNDNFENPWRPLVLYNITVVILYQFAYHFDFLYINHYSYLHKVTPYCFISRNTTNIKWVEVKNIVFLK